MTVVVRGPALEHAMSAYLVEQDLELRNVDVRTVVTAAERDGLRLTGLRLRASDGGEQTIPVDACSVFIGASPRTDWLEGVVARDEHGFVLAGRDVPAERWPLERPAYELGSSVPGVFVAGDVRAHPMKRVASAVGEGATAVSLVPST